MDKYKRWLRRLPLIIGVAMTLIIAVAVYIIQGQFDKPVQTKKQVQQIMMIQPPPPPPPPPPPEEKPPEPEPEKPIEEPEPDDEPEPTPEEADEPAGEELGLDAEGTAGSDGFGLLGKKGGRGLLGGGGGGSAILWYGGQVKRNLEEELQALLSGSKAREASYSVLIHLWIGNDGRVTRAELAGSSGKEDIDRSLSVALPKLRIAVGKPPPDNMPQPLKIRVTSKI